jgi:ribosomal protein L11 methyltransferase
LTADAIEPTIEPCAALVADVADDAIESVSDRLWWLGANAIGEEPRPGGTRLVAGFDTISAARAAASALAPLAARVDPIDDDWWMDEWKTYAQPVEVGQSLLIVPSWQDRPRTDRVVIELDSERAFGSGSHPSTILALAQLEKLMFAGARVADIGSGSGVLAIAAALLGAGKVIAVDIDPLARLVTATNAARNHVGDKVTVAGSTLDDIDHDVTGSFDIVAANIGAAALEQMAAALMALAPVIVLSGLLQTQSARLVSAFASYRGAISDPIDGWVAVVMMRGD